MRIALMLEDSSNDRNITSHWNPFFFISLRMSDIQIENYKYSIQNSSYAIHIC